MIRLSSRRAKIASLARFKRFACLCSFSSWLRSAASTRSRCSSRSRSRCAARSISWVKPSSSAIGEVGGKVTDCPRPRSWAATASSAIDWDARRAKSRATPRPLSNSNRPPPPTVASERYKIAFSSELGTVNAKNQPVPRKRLTAA